jgi:branched-chain amino acid transport system substrate-binding protein
MTEERDQRGRAGASGAAPGGATTRRGFLKLAGATTAAAALLPTAAAATSRPTARRTGSRVLDADARTIKIGYVSPQTGPLAPFGQADNYVLDGVQSIFAKGITSGGVTYPVQIITKDSQSSPDRAATVAGELITDAGIDMMLVASTPETTNPVADQCEANGVPCISSVAPWQPYFFGRQADAANPVPFQWTYHFFWGLEDIISVFLDMWGQIDTNKVVGGLFPNDGDGNAWGDADLGFPKPLQAAGYTMIDPGRYENGTNDFTAQITAFKAAGVEILTGVPIPPDFTNFWTQAAQQGFVPKIASVGKALLFPSSVDALGALGQNLSSEYWWGPTSPFTSSLTSQTAQQLADGYTTSTGEEWTQPIGFAHALFEVANDALTRTTNIDDKASIVEAIKATNLATIVGTVDFTLGKPFPNIAKTPLVGGQWVTASGDFPYQLIVVSNTDQPEIPKAAAMQPITPASAAARSNVG